MVNELEYVENLITNKKLSTKVNFDIRLLAVYFYGQGFIQKEELVNEISNVIDTCLGKKNVWEVQIKKAVDSHLARVKDSGYAPLKNITSIEVYEEELEVIQSLKDKKKEKMLFAILVYLKLTNTNYLPHELIKEVRTISGIKRITVASAQDIIREILSEEYNGEQILSKVNSQKVAIVYNFKKEEGKVAFIIKDFSDEGIPLYYDRYCGEKVKECIECGKLILIKGNNNKYCSKCREEKEMEKAKNRMKNHRKNLKK